MPCPLQRLAGRGALWALAAVLVGAAPGGRAQTEPPPSTEPPPQKRIRAVRTDNPPLIDGVLDDAVWQKAEPASDFRMKEPIADGDPAEPTEVRVLFDSNFLYVAVRLFDRNPSELAITKMERDSSMITEDSIALVLDTFHDRRNSYFLQVNAANTKRDALMEDNRRFLPDWDGIWYSRTSIDATGWSAEFAVPFKTVSFDPTSDTWGFNVSRRLRHLNQDIVWANPDPNYSILDVSRIGTIEGLYGLEQGIGLDVKPAMAAIWERKKFENATGNHTDRDLRIEPGADLFYKVTPSLTAAATVNSDFSEAPTDTVRINLTRFALFFPETRDFFLQDAGIFEFADIRQESGLPFFSRKIGLDGAEVVDLYGGGKLTGRVGPFNVGLLDVQMEPYTPDGESEEVDSKNLFVGRASMNILEESSFGLIATNGDPDTNDNNFLAGTDLRYRDSSFLGGDKSLTADIWYQRSFSSGTHGDRESAFGATLDYPNDIWNGRLRYQLFDDDYNPGLGFVTRLAIKRYEGRLRHRWRPPGPIRTVDVQLDGRLVTELGNSLETGLVDFDFLDVRNDPGDRVRLRYGYRTERLRDDQTFELVEDIFIEQGSYDFHRGSILIEAGPSRRVGGALELGYGGFWGGRSFDTIARLELRPSPHFNLILEWEQRDVRDSGLQVINRNADDGAIPPFGDDRRDFTARVARVRAIFNANPNLSWDTRIQYAALEDLVTANSRLRWIIEEGNEVYLVLNQDYEANHDTVVPTRTQTVFKVQYTFRF